MFDTYNGLYRPRPTGYCFLTLSIPWYIQTHYLSTKPSQTGRSRFSDPTGHYPNTHPAIHGIYPGLPGHHHYLIMTPPVSHQPREQCPPFCRVGEKEKDAPRKRKRGKSKIPSQKSHQETKQHHHLPPPSQDQEKARTLKDGISKIGTGSYMWLGRTKLQVYAFGCELMCGVQRDRAHHSPYGCV